MVNAVEEANRGVWHTGTAMQAVRVPEMRGG